MYFTSAILVLTNVLVLFVFFLHDYLQAMLFPWCLKILFSLWVTFAAKKDIIIYFNLILSNIAIADIEAFKHDLAHCTIS